MRYKMNAPLYMTPTVEFLPITEHTITVKTCLLFLQDKNIAEPAKRGVRVWLNHLLDDFRFDDKYAVKIGGEIVH